MNRKLLNLIKTAQIFAHTVVSYYAEANDFSSLWNSVHAQLEPF